MKRCRSERVIRVVVAMGERDEKLTGKIVEMCRSLLFLWEVRSRCAECVDVDSRRVDGWWLSRRPRYRERELIVGDTCVEEAWDGFAMCLSRSRVEETNRQE